MEHQSDLTGSLNPSSDHDVSRTLDQMEQQQPTPKTAENKISGSQYKVLMVLALMILIVFAVMIGVNVSNSNASSANQNIQQKHVPSIDPIEDKPSLSPQYRTLIPIAPTISFSSNNPSNDPSNSPDTELPSNDPSNNPSNDPSNDPSHSPDTELPSNDPSNDPSHSPDTELPSNDPSNNPQSVSPSDNPSNNPTLKTDDPTLQTSLPSNNPSNSPQTVSPSDVPSITETEQPSECGKGFSSTSNNGCRIVSCGNQAWQRNPCQLLCNLDYVQNDAGYSMINLDEHIAYNNDNNDEHIDFTANGGFSKYAYNVHIMSDGHTLSASLGSTSGNTRYIDLDQYITLTHGELKWSSCFVFSTNVPQPPTDTPKHNPSSNPSIPPPTEFPTDLLLNRERIQSKSSGKCIEMSTKNNRINYADCWGGDNQKWYYHPDTKSIRNVYNNYCLELSGNVYVGSAAPCNGGINQKWTLQGDEIKSNVNGQCLDIENGQISLYVDHCNGSREQKWQF